MLLSFRCRRCRRPLSVESDQKGATIHCPHCQCEMIVPAASEPSVPRGQILAGIYAFEKDDSKGESAPDPVQHSIREMTIRDLLPGEKKPSDKSKDKPRGPHTPPPPRRNHHCYRLETERGNPVRASFPVVCFYEGRGQSRGRARQCKEHGNRGLFR